MQAGQRSPWIRGLLRPHRGASLYFGRNEGGALRCVYHGWAFDADGRCVDMPSEPAPFCGKVRMRAYPVHESGGIVWAYLGPRETMTPFRDFGTGGLGAGEVMATKQHSACNWVREDWRLLGTDADPAVQEAYEVNEVSMVSMVSMVSESSEG